MPQEGSVGAPKLNWKARSKLRLYAPKFDFILRENGGRSFCFQNAAFSIQTITHTHTHTHTPSYWRASAWPDGSTRSFPTCIKLFLWFYSQFPVAMLIAPNCPSQLYGSNQALHISAAWAGFTADSTDHATWRVVTDIRKYDLMWHLPYVLNVVWLSDWVSHAFTAMPAIVNGFVFPSPWTQWGKYQVIN